MVTVTSLAWGVTPIANRAYYIEALDGTVLGKIVTDASGNATGTMPATGYLTSLDANNHLFLHRVEPGDHVYDVDTSGPPPAIPQVNVAVTVPLASSATNYAFSSSCGGAGTAIGASGKRTMSFDTGCTGDVIVVANNASGTPVAFAFVSGVVFDGTPVDLSAQTYAAIGSTQIDVTNTVFNRVSLGADLIDTAGVVDSLSGGAQTIVQNGAASMPLPAYGVSGTTDLILLGFSTNPTNPSDDPGATESVTVWGAEGNHAIDASTTLLHDIPNPPAFDLASRTVSWTEATSGVDAQLFEARIECTRDVNGKGVSFTVRVDGPHVGTSFAIPTTLPTDVFDFGLQPTDVCKAGVILTSSTVDPALVRQRTPAGTFTGINPFTGTIMPGSVVLAGSGQALSAQRLQR